MDWKPISEERLLGKINVGRARLNPLERRFWDAICIDPEKWQQAPYGDLGGGFWVVAILGRIVIWFNDIEDGFNWSQYENYGTIPSDEYWSNQDDLEWPVRDLMRFVETGEFPTGRSGPPLPGEYQPKK